jgi:hypothetical protein
METTQQQDIQTGTAEKKRRPWWKKILRFFLWTGIIVIVFIGLLAGAAFIFEDEIKG